MSLILNCRYVSGATIVTVSGEIDAYNVDEVSSYVGRTMATAQALIVDLRGVKFLGIAGFRALLRINDDCATAGVPWALVTSDAVDVLLRAGARNRHLPAMHTVEAALQQLAAFAQRSMPVAAPDAVRC